MENNSVSDWFEELKRIWVEKDHSAIKALLAESFTWYENPLEEPLTNLNEVEKVWLETNNQHEIDIVITPLIIKDHEGFTKYDCSFYDVDNNQHVSSGSYYVKLNDDGKAVEFRQWWVSK